MTADAKTGNFILDGLNEEEYRRLSVHFEYVDLPLEKEFDPSDTAHFPVEGIVSMLLVLESGETSEIGLVGPEGMFGLESFLRGATPTVVYKVQSKGRAIKLPGRALKAEFQQSGALHERLLAYAQTLFMHTAQTAVCNRHHTVEQQLCRWLLLSLDRIGGDEIVMTQGMIADMLGVRRAGVSVAASGLQREGIIQYSRGDIIVLDRPALERRSCECYEIVRSGYEEFHGPYRPGAERR